MRLDIYYDGSIVVTTPPGKRRSSVEKFLERNKKKLELINSVDRRAIHSTSKKRYIRYKDEAFTIVLDRIAHFNDIYKFSLGNISIRNQKARWGSCSEAGDLIYNYKIIFLPEVYRDYIIVHELCHLKELNHSNRFWDLVSLAIPDYLNIKKELAIL